MSSSRNLNIVQGRLPLFIATILAVVGAIACVHTVMTYFELPERITTGELIIRLVGGTLLTVGGLFLYFMYLLIQQYREKDNSLKEEQNQPG